MLKRMKLGQSAVLYCIMVFCVGSVSQSLIVKRSTGGDSGGSGDETGAGQEVTVVSVTEYSDKEDNTTTTTTRDPLEDDWTRRPRIKLINEYPSWFCNETVECRTPFTECDYRGSYTDIFGVTHQMNKCTFITNFIVLCIIGLLLFLILLSFFG